MIGQESVIWVHRTTYHLYKDRQCLQPHHHIRRNTNCIALGYCTLDCLLHCNSFDCFLEPMVIAKTIQLCRIQEMKAKQTENEY